MCPSAWVAIVVTTGRAHRFHDYIYINPILLLWDLSTLCVVDYLWQKFRLQFENYKSKHRSFRKEKHNVLQKRFCWHYVQDCHRGIDNGEVTLYEKCETHKQLKQIETFWQHILKTFYPLVLNEKEKYLF